MSAILTFYLQSPQIYNDNPQDALAPSDLRNKESDTKWFCEKIHEYLIRKNITNDMREGKIDPLKLKKILETKINTKDIIKDIYNRFDKEDQEYDREISEAIRIFEKKKESIITNIREKYEFYLATNFSR